jgi:hypothetical protein
MNMKETMTDKKELAVNLCGFAAGFPGKQGVLDGLTSKIYRDIEARRLPLGDRLVSRVYIGSEFCSRFLDFSASWRGAVEKITEMGYGITFVLPNVVEGYLPKIKEIIALLADCRPDKLEIAVNDIGMLNYVAREYPHIDLAAGLLFYKTSRDPRIDLLSLDDFKNNREILQESPLSSPATAELFKLLKVKRLEFDLLEHGFDMEPLMERYDLSVHFPCIYVTSGNVCPLGALNLEPREKFKLESGCSRECNRYYAHIDNPAFRGEVFQFGGAILYSPPYDIDGVTGFLAAAGSRLRVVYSLLSLL